MKPSKPPKPQTVLRTYVFFLVGQRKRAQGSKRVQKIPKGSGHILKSKSISIKFGKPPKLQHVMRTRRFSGRAAKGTKRVLKGPRGFETSRTHCQINQQRMKIEEN